MNTHNRSQNGWLTFTLVITCVVLIITLPAALSTTAKALPPRPTVPSPSDDIDLDPSALAQIQLQAQFPDSWPWQTTHWQDLWTIVQWQDPQGTWYDVEGWQGTLDKVEISEDGAITGYKTWWVGGEHMGKGPFRWLVYQDKGDRLLATSESFDLPSINRALLVIETTLTP